MDKTLINITKGMVRRKNIGQYFAFLALKKKYKLTKNDLKKVPKPHYKYINIIKKMFDPQRKLKEFMK